MNTKIMVFLTCSIVLASLSFISCEQSPNDYQEKLDDYVKYTVSAANFIVKATNDLEKVLIEETIPPIVEEREKGEGSCRDILIKLSKAGDLYYTDGYKYMLSQYDSITILLSEYIEVPITSEQRIWHFTEVNTGLKYEFILSDDDWVCNVTDESLNAYVNQNVHTPIHVYDEIVDAVKFQIAKHRLMFDILGGSKSDEAKAMALVWAMSGDAERATFYESFDFIEEAYLEGGGTYKEILSKLTDTRNLQFLQYYDLCKPLFDHYNNASAIILGFENLGVNDYGEERWAFVETSTGLKFTFLVFESWSIIPDGNSLGDFVMKYVGIDMSELDMEDIKN